MHKYQFINQNLEYKRDIAYLQLSFEVHPRGKNQVLAPVESINRSIAKETIAYRRTNSFLKKLKTRDEQ